MKIVITGNHGFIGKNLEINLLTHKNFKINVINRDTNNTLIKNYIFNCDILIHTAGVNRPKRKYDFVKDNFNFTNKILEYLNKKKHQKIIYLSTIKYNEKTLYGISKKKSEQSIIKNSRKLNYNYLILRLPNVFGKWCRPNYNSFISTIIYNITREKKLPKISKIKKIDLLYIDDLIQLIIKNLKKNKNSKILNVKGRSVKLYQIVKKLNIIWNNWKLNKVNKTSNSLDRKLYSTLISYLPKKYHIRQIQGNFDKRGVFVEFLKTTNSGQISFFTINPRQERGNHFHNTKNEKFLVLSGKVKYETENLNSNEKISKLLDSKKFNVITSIPGWKHSFKNLSKNKAIIIVWSNEIFDKRKPDTYLKINEK